MIVRNRKKIASGFPNLVVKCDRTPKPYEELATLCTTLAARKAAGENVDIKYRNNCPEIVTVQNEHLLYPKRSRGEEGSPEHNPRKSTKPDHATHSNYQYAKIMSLLYLMEYKRLQKHGISSYRHSVSTFSVFVKLGYTTAWKHPPPLQTVTKLYAAQPSKKSLEDELAEKVPDGMDLGITAGICEDIHGWSALTDTSSLLRITRLLIMWFRNLFSGLVLFLDSRHRYPLGEAGFAVSTSVVSLCSFQKKDSDGIGSTISSGTCKYIRGWVSLYDTSFPLRNTVLLAKSIRNLLLKISIPKIIFMVRCGSISNSCTKHSCPTVIWGENAWVMVPNQDECSTFLLPH
ncbi:hypothetical protein JTB14_015129 [Gonioctena quinquepunctata]|nr:hypothetical protein JTB14_015129 [Gonioctena quinquepunctata]